MIKQEQNEEMVNISTKEEIEARNKRDKEKDELSQALLHYATAEASGGIKTLIDCEGCAFYLYEMLGYRKIDEFAECRNCTAWSGTDCTRHPYTQGCLKDENNIKRQAVQEFAEKLKDYINDKVVEEFNDMAVDLKYFTIDIDEFEEYIDELLKEYEE